MKKKYLLFILVLNISGVISKDITSLKDKSNFQKSGNKITLEHYTYSHIDYDLSGSHTSGDIIYYDTILSNPVEDILDPVFSIVPSEFTTLENTNIIITPILGFVITHGTSLGDEYIEASADISNAFANIHIHHQATVDEIMQGDSKLLISHAILESSNLGTFLSEDLKIGLPFEPPITRAYGPALTIYDEIINGDLNNSSDPSEILINRDTVRISGTVGGTSEDSEDCFQFSLSSNRSVLDLIIENYNATENNSTLLQVFTGTPSSNGGIGDIINLVIKESKGGYGVLSPIILTNNTYSVCISDQVPNQSYSLVINSEFLDFIFTNNFEQPL